MEENMNNSTPQEAGTSAGPIIAGIVILAVIVFGALFFMGERDNDQALENRIDTIEAQSSSDETADIEADLEATDVNNLDAELNSY